MSGRRNDLDICLSQSLPLLLLSGSLSARPTNLRHITDEALDVTLHAIGAARIPRLSFLIGGGWELQGILDIYLPTFKRLILPGVFDSLRSRVRKAHLDDMR